MILRVILIVAGILSLLAGIIGVFLPVLPTTPFLLLSAACFLKSSRRLYRWLTEHPVFGAYIKNYLKYRAITVRSKIISIALLWAVMLCTILFFTDKLWVRIVLLMVAAGVSIHLALMRTLTREMLEEQVAESISTPDACPPLPGE